MLEDVLQLIDIRQTYMQALRPLDVLQGVYLTLRRGEIVALLGPSGSGKSTLLHIAGLMEKPKAGSIVLDGTDVADLNDRKRSRIRCGSIGFVYQSHCLLAEFSALENVVMPQLINRKTRSNAEKRALTLLRACGLEQRLHHRPARLSGGEQQRVAIARALANNPQILLADEPTGNLDPKTAEQVFDLMRAQIRARGATALIATHNFALAALADRRLQLLDGTLQPLTED